MARVKISEYRAKRIILGDAYKGVSVRTDVKTKLPAKGKWVAKVDQGVVPTMRRVSDSQNGLDSKTARIFLMQKRIGKR